MAIDTPLRLPEQPGSGNHSAPAWDDPPADNRPRPGLGPELLEQIRAAAAAVDNLPAALCQLGEDQLSDLMSALMRLHVRTGHVAALAVADAQTRGTIGGTTAANPTQWIRNAATAADVSIEAREAALIAGIGDATCDRRNHVITDAVTKGTCTLPTARTALRETGKVTAVLPDAAREDVHAWFLALDPALGARGVTQLTRRIIAKYDPDQLQRDDERVEAQESLSWSTLPTGMLRLVAQLCPANAAILKQAINSLSAPHPSREHEAATRAPHPDTPSSDAAAADNPASDDPLAAGTKVENEDDGAASGAQRHTNDADTRPAQKVRDERTPGKRRVDALMDLLATGAKVASGDGVSVGAAATLLVTMDLHALHHKIGGGTTIDGDVLDASTARRFACDANLIPIVLGGPSQPLDVGREVRLVTGGMRAAVVHRDICCTFPGCDRPPGFCEVHHLLPWWAGGGTSLTNSALVCRRHHHVIHQRGLLGTVTAHGVTWDLTPARIPGWLADRAA